MASVGFTLVELLASMAILSVLMLVLGLMLETSLNRFRNGAERIEQRGDARVVADWMERDLGALWSNRPAPLPRLPEETSEAQRAFFEGRLFLPFEVDRASGTANPHGGSFANAAAGFSSLAFVAQVPDPDQPTQTAAPSIVGYYVAYARHSPLADDAAAGMKLFRHYRRGGHPTADGYADRILQLVSKEINDGREDSSDPGAPILKNPAAVRRGKFNNADLPFFYSQIAGESVVHPWPALPVSGVLKEEPPTRHPFRGEADDWKNPGSPVHDSVFADEALCDHVVRFEVRPFRLVSDEAGQSRPMDAAALNAHLGLDGGDEWPVLVTPEYLEVLISVIPESTALRLSTPDDWKIDWKDPGIETRDPRLVGMRSHRFRIHLPRI